MFDEKGIKKLKELDVKDSKLVPHKKRLILDIEIRKIAKSKVIEIPPKEIDEAVDGDNELNLNWLEAEKTIEIINELKPDTAIIDCPSVNIEKYEEYIRERLNQKVNLIVEHKADVNYIESGAASILAKVARENQVEELKKKYGEIGSGYPSDPTTKEFLKKNYQKHPEIFRKSWSTFKKYVTGKKQKKLGEF
ncbi:MAG: ribonuclease HII [Nanoarchaeota archaeon]|nr:ribonuclease HII [Nanoarchaeota archaeon]MBU1445606.1 ribonuclease HII [Nanoarchaeota archaeon]MBU2420787.1 ribonuclease HII [Nanoarchaeota archaeon]MBU2475166.1 ribonuclease HII [Nanoarchaeota archaeon]